MNTYIKCKPELAEYLLDKAGVFTQGEFTDISASVFADIHNGKISRRSASALSKKGYNIKPYILRIAPQDPHDPIQQIYDLAVQFGIDNATYDECKSFIEYNNKRGWVTNDGKPLDKKWALHEWFNKRKKNLEGSNEISRILEESGLFN